MPGAKVQVRAGRIVPEQAGAAVPNGPVSSSGEATFAGR